MQHSAERRGFLARFEQHHAERVAAKETRRHMRKHRQPEEQRRRTPNLRRVRHPWHLEELETAAQTDVDMDVGAEPTAQPAEDEAQRGIALGTSGGHRAGRDPEALPVDPGLSIDPEDLGLQFLRDATEQDNFESEFQPEAPTVPDSLVLGQMTSDESLLSAGQEEIRVSYEPPPITPAEEHEEPFLSDVDLLSNVIYEASLFDHPLEQDDETQSPRVESDENEPTAPDLEAREREQERERKLLRRLRYVRPHRRKAPERS